MALIAPVPAVESSPVARIMLMKPSEETISIETVSVDYLSKAGELHKAGNRSVGQGGD